MNFIFEGFRSTLKLKKIHRFLSNLERVQSSWQIMASSSCLPSVQAYTSSNDTSRQAHAMLGVCQSQASQVTCILHMALSILAYNMYHRFWVPFPGMHGVTISGVEYQSSVPQHAISAIHNHIHDNYAYNDSTDIFACPGSDWAPAIPLSRAPGRNSVRQLATKIYFVEWRKGWRLRHFTSACACASGI